VVGGAREAAGSRACGSRARGWEQGVWAGAGCAGGSRVCREEQSVRVEVGQAGGSGILYIVNSLFIYFYLYSIIYLFYNELSV